MTARRQPSTTSLSKFARDGSPDPAARSLDFCNAFWGLSDGGVDVLFARMRGAGRTTEELRNFWKERAAIEEDYAKRLAKLAKMSVGRDEIGELRNSLDTLRSETEKQAGFHLQLAQQVRNDLEGPTNAFVARQAQHRKVVQSAIEKQFKVKQAQETHVNKAREKYEADCIRINSFTAQSTLVQGKDLESISRKLERTQQTVKTNERDFANFSRALNDTVGKWEHDWKAFCDSCQDMEEDRMEFLKDIVWAYANAVSIVCVSDDESCEHLRLALEQFEPEKDQESFVRDYGTGDAMPDPPQFINYSIEGAPLPSSSSKPTSRPAQFVRSSQRVNKPLAAQPPPNEEETLVNTAGVGAGGRGSMDPGPNRSQTQSRASTRAPPNGMNGNGGIPVSPSASSRPGTSHTDRAPGMVDPTTHKTMLKVGDNAYEVDLNKDPRQQQSARGSVSAATKVGDETDPMVKAMASLRSAAGTIKRGTADSQASSSPTKALTPPTSASAAHNQSRDYRNSAELVVGAYPLAAGGSSRPSSPNPPTAALMQPPRQAPAPYVDAALEDYQQSFPGEIQQRRSRSNSRRESFNGPPLQHQQQIQQQQQPSPGPQRNSSRGQALERPVSREGHAGIGANGRSPSPSLRHPTMQSSRPRSVSPAPGNNGMGGASLDYRDSYSSQQRPHSRNSVGIALDQRGNVSMDSMAESYLQQQQRQQQQQQQQQQQPYQTHAQQAQQQQLQAPSSQSVQRRTSMTRGYSVQQAPPPGAYGAQQPHLQSQVYRAQQQQPSPARAPQQQLSYTQPPAHSPIYAPPPTHPYAAAATPAQAFHPPPPQQQYAPPPPANGALQRGMSASGAEYYGVPAHQSYGSQAQQQQQLGYGGGYRSGSPGPINRSPSPQPIALSQPHLGHAPHQQQVVPPTRQYTDDGRGVLFYVKALYDYTATIPEEFDFQAGDIIAVTATPEDGWWSGELLDEARRVPGRHIFPSNFVSLF
ncbi:hypothetical protein HETIRDRAFT_447044 [Heterobasidion irregulare TC 32-1]|uniref:SH3 domain-containing protein n=1 Tax=Heterobasidion irregulare (strain TC 32-1) TaxID=747525 RepID=W4JMH9_HETIT|nr:uncharacterized protein HETIRDRAFT_447044 [Heterobasidion irregulare TC 32-1]ETW74674.1 hypothetical protein HETIRDRAFT_447044 [Heterobasidion irregulare TC 32-1]